MEKLSNDAELKIVEAAIACIEKFGLNDTTVRKIAAEAEVNVAAVNYYFGSKEELIDRALEKTLQNAFDWSDFASSEDFPPKERLCAILEHLAAGAQIYPEISRTHFYGRLVGNNANSDTMERLNAFLEKIYDDLTARGASLSGPELRFAIIQAVSASIFGIGLLSELSSQFTKTDICAPEVRKQYIESLVSHVLA